jgi:hypothetical protein
METDSIVARNSEAGPDQTGSEMNEDDLTSMKSFVSIKLGFKGSIPVRVTCPSLVTRKQFEDLVFHHLKEECNCEWIGPKGNKMVENERIILKRDGRLKSITTQFDPEEAIIWIGLQGEGLIELEVPRRLSRKEFEGLMFAHLRVRCNCSWIGRDGLHLEDDEVIVITKEGKLFRRETENLTTSYLDHSYEQDDEPELDLVAVQEDQWDDGLNYSDGLWREKCVRPRRDWRGELIPEKEAHLKWRERQCQSKRSLRKL